MKITVFGATGGIGAHVCERALAQGHQVTAFARRPTAVRASGERLRVVVGDALTGAGIDEAIGPESVVISCLGSRTPTKRGDPVASSGARHIIAAMRAVGASRLIAVSSVGVGAANDNSWLVNVLVRPAFALFFAPARDDFDAMEALVAGSGLDWTLARASSLTDGPARDRYVIERDLRRVGPFISRADVAAFFLREAEKPVHIRARVTLSNAWSELVRPAVERRAFTA
jgi:putative NADH-flavin reductase